MNMKVEVEAPDLTFNPGQMWKGGCSIQSPTLITSPIKLPKMKL